LDLERFVDAQNPVYDSVLAELRAGRKVGHWMWFIFPQLRGLGHSQMSYKYGISNQAEAEAYLNHPVLGPRLVECTQLAKNMIFEYPDNVKFKSSMALFASASKALNKYDGEFKVD
jgi:uncharacterized protein (DUF1810 family)